MSRTPVTPSSWAKTWVPAAASRKRLVVARMLTVLRGVENGSVADLLLVWSWTWKEGGSGSRGRRARRSLLMAIGTEGYLEVGGFKVNAKVQVRYFFRRVTPKELRRPERDQTDRGLIYGIPLYHVSFLPHPWKCRWEMSWERRRKRHHGAATAVPCTE